MNNENENYEKQEKIIIRLTKEAEQGDAKAQYELGKCYFYGEDLPKNINKAIEWLTKSAEQNNAEAQYILGKYNISPENNNRDEKKAAEWLTKAAKQGHNGAKFALAFCYLFGIGVPTNVNKMFDLLGDIVTEDCRNLKRWSYNDKLWFYFIWNRYLKYHKNADLFLYYYSYYS